jgi:RES domain-containing protein
MYDFPAWDSYSVFAQRVKRRERYVRSPEALAFLSAVTATSQKRLRMLNAGSLFCRAQLGCDWEPVDSHPDALQPSPYSTKRMLPLPDAPTEGRANPCGIPALYLATTPETAVAEVRPWVGKFVSLAQFKLMQEVRVVDCSQDHGYNALMGPIPPDPAMREAAVWGDINRAFSQPTSIEDDRTTYVPTQVLAEHFRALGANGVVYNSSLGRGLNLALFQLHAAEVINCTVHQVRSVQFGHEEVTNPYFVRKHYPELGSD